MPYPRAKFADPDVGWAEQERMRNVRVVPLARQEAGMPLICVKTLSRNIRRPNAGSNAPGRFGTAYASPYADPRS